MNKTYGSKTRKGWSLTAILLMTVLVLSACGSKATDGGSTNGAQASNELEQIKSAGVIKVGMMGTYAPYNFLNDKKEMDGYDADIAVLRSDLSVQVIYKGGARVCPAVE